VMYAVSGKLAYSSGLIRREGISTTGGGLRGCSLLERGSLGISGAFEGDEFGILPTGNSSFSSLLYGRTDVTLKSTTLLLTCTLQVYPSIATSLYGPLQYVSFSLHIRTSEFNGRARVVEILGPFHIRKASEICLAEWQRRTSAIAFRIVVARWVVDAV